MALACAACLLMVIKCQAIYRACIYRRQGHGAPHAAFCLYPQARHRNTYTMLTEIHSTTYERPPAPVRSRATGGNHPSVYRFGLQLGSTRPLDGGLPRTSAPAPFDSRTGRLSALVPHDRFTFLFAERRIYMYMYVRMSITPLLYAYVCNFIAKEIRDQQVLLSEKKYRSAQIIHE